MDHSKPWITGGCAWTTTRGTVCASGREITPSAPAAQALIRLIKASAVGHVVEPSSTRCGSRQMSWWGVIMRCVCSAHKATSIVNKIVLNKQIIRVGGTPAHQHSPDDGGSHHRPMGKNHLQLPLFEISSRNRISLTESPRRGASCNVPCSKIL